MNEMKRLTKRLPSGTAVPSENWIPTTYEATCQELAQRLADYEDAEEQGRLIEFPVAIGDTLYYVPKWLHDKRIDTVTVTGLRLMNNGDKLIEVNGSKLIGGLQNVCWIGEDFFLTMEEAEARLKELGGQT